MWSLGCIFAEMIGGKPVFNGKTTLNQVELIVNFLGAQRRTRWTTASTATMVA